MANACLVHEGDTIIWAVNREKQSFVLVKIGGCPIHRNPPPPPGTPHSDCLSMVGTSAAPRSLLRLHRAGQSDLAMRNAAWIPSLGCHMAASSRWRMMGRPCSTS